MDMLVNTDAVMSAADRLNDINEKIQKDFPRAEKGVNSLKGSWDSEAAEKAFAKFNQIKNSLSEPRYNTMKNYINFLRQAVCEGYEQTEEVNKSLADAFK